MSPAASFTCLCVCLHVCCLLHFVVLLLSAVGSLSHCCSPPAGWKWLSNRCNQGVITSCHPPPPPRCYYSSSSLILVTQRWFTSSGITAASLCWWVSEFWWLLKVRVIFVWVVTLPGHRTRVKIHVAALKLPTFSIPNNNLQEKKKERPPAVSWNLRPSWVSGDFVSLTRLCCVLLTLNRRLLMGASDWPGVWAAMVTL